MSNQHIIPRFLWNKADVKHILQKEYCASYNVVGFGNHVTYGVKTLNTSYSIFEMFISSIQLEIYQVGHMVDAS